MQGLGQFARAAALKINLHSCTDCVTVAGASFEPHGQIVVARIDVIAQQTNLRSGATGNPQILIAVMIPIDEGHPATIVDQVQCGGGRYIGKPLAPGVQERTMSFPAAEAATSADHGSQGVPLLEVVVAGLQRDKLLG